MKKKVLALLAMLCMVISMVGCSKEATSYLGKLKEVSAWEAQEATGILNLGFSVGEEKMNFKIDYAAYRNIADNKVEVTFAVKEVSGSGVTIDTTKGQYKIAPLKIFVTASEAYMGTDIVKDIARLSKTDISSVEALNKSYVGIDLKDYMKQMGLAEEALSAQDKTKRAWEMLEKTGVELPVKQDKDTYTIALNEEQIFKFTFDFAEKFIMQNKDFVVAQYKAQGMSDEQINTLFATISAVNTDEVKAEVVKATKGSTAKLTNTFTADSYTTKLDVNMNVISKAQTISFSISLEDTTKKAIKRAVELPKDVKVYTMADITKMITDIDEKETVK